MQNSLFEREVEVISQMRPLWYSQPEALVKVREAIREGHKRIMLQAPTGWGKTLWSAHVIAAALRKGNRPLFTAPAISLVDQTYAAFKQEGIHDIGIMQAQHAYTNPNAALQIASVQTLIRRAVPDVKLVIVDECFPAGTMISTARGPKPIEKIVPGEVIPHALGIGRVLSLFSKSHNQFVTLRLSNGASIRCTPDHPIFTLSGWKKAGELEARERIFRQKDLYCLRAGVQAVNTFKGSSRRVSRIREGLQRAAMLLQLLRKETQESDVAPGCAGTSFGGFESDGPQTVGAGRKRKAASGDTGASARNSWGRMGFRICGEDESKTAGIPPLLQGGSSQPEFDDWDRVGWYESFLDYAQGAGPEEGRPASLVWVESVETKELPRAEPVYNLRVSGHPSYFANGVLVHNCHEVFEGLTALLNSPEWQDVIVIGLSATPWTKGLGLIFTKLIIADTIQGMIDCGRSRKFPVYGPEHDIERESLAVSKGEFEEASSAAAMSSVTIVGDVLREWKERSSGDKTFAFCVNRDHARAQMEAFQDCGISFGYIDANTPVGVRDTEEGTRKNIFAQMRNGVVAGIASVGCLIRGVDEIVYNILDLQPSRSEIRLVQKWGRMRTSDPNANYAGFDHAGNNLALGMFWDIHHDTLDMRQPGERGEAYKEDYTPAKPRKCSKCHSLVPPGARSCPSCMERLPLQSGVVVKDGRLVELGSVPKMTKQHQDFYSELLTIARSKNLKDGWAAYRFRDKFGMNPTGLKVRRKLAVSDEVKSFVKAERAKWLESQAEQQSMDRTGVGA